MDPSKAQPVRLHTPQPPEQKHGIVCVCYDYVLVGSRRTERERAWNGNMRHDFKFELINSTLIKSFVNFHKIVHADHEWREPQPIPQLDGP